MEACTNCKHGNNQLSPFIFLKPSLSCWPSLAIFWLCVLSFHPFKRSWVFSSVKSRFNFFLYLQRKKKQQQQFLWIFLMSNIFTLNYYCSFPSLLTFHISIMINCWNQIKRYWKGNKWEKAKDEKKAPSLDTYSIVWFMRGPLLSKVANFSSVEAPEKLQGSDIAHEVWKEMHDGLSMIQTVLCFRWLHVDCSFQAVFILDSVLQQTVTNRIWLQSTNKFKEAKRSNFFPRLTSLSKEISAFYPTFF